MQYSGPWCAYNRVLQWILHFRIITRESLDTLKDGKDNIRTKTLFLVVIWEIAKYPWRSIHGSWPSWPSELLYYFISGYIDLAFIDYVCENFQKPLGQKKASKKWCCIICQIIPILYFGRHKLWSVSYPHLYRHM